MTNRLLDSRPFIQLNENVRVIPVVHGSAEISLLIRRCFLENPPETLFLELPGEFTGPLYNALPYAQEIPILSYEQPHMPDALFILEPLEPVTEAARSAFELNIPIRLIDRYNPVLFGISYESFPDTYSLKSMALKDMYDVYSRGRPARPAALSDISTMDDPLFIADTVRELNMAKHIRYAPKNSLVVCGVRHVENIKHYCSLQEESFQKIYELAREKLDSEMPPYEEEPLEAVLKSEDSDSEKRISTYILSRESPEVLTQPPYTNMAWNMMRRDLKTLKGFDRIQINRMIYRDARHRYERESGEIFPPQREKLFFRFARNWSLIDSYLLPDTYKLVMSARAFGNDNFARIFHDTIMYLKPAQNTPFHERKLSLDELFKDSKKVRFRITKKVKRRVAPPPIRKNFKKEKYPGEWKETWNGSGLCSYPPEDIIIEDYAKYLQKKANHLLKGSEARVHEFTSSIMDGIDYRETIRNAHIGKVFVKEINRQSVDAGSVVIIFSDDHEEHPWDVVWWGEHNQESDMAFYATELGEEIVGPGISRCRYGGLMLTYPPGRLHDIWSDPSYSQLEHPRDKLLLGAIEYNERKAVVHVADRAPSPRMNMLAARYGQKIIHIPISTLNPVQLGRVRRFHVLNSRDRRDDAGDYIW